MLLSEFEIDALIACLIVCTALVGMAYIIITGEDK